VQHKIYNLDSKQTFLGIDLSDIMIGLITWMLGNFLTGEFLPPRLQTLVTVLTMGLVLTIWKTFKDKLPPGFIRHFFSWVTEANAYRVGPDTQSRPAVVDHHQVLGFLSTEKKSREQLGSVRVEPAYDNLNVRQNLSHDVKLALPPRPAPVEDLQDAPLPPRVTVANAE